MLFIVLICCLHCLLLSFTTNNTHNNNNITVYNTNDTNTSGAQLNEWFVRTRVGDRIGYQLRGIEQSQAVLRVVKMQPSFYLHNGIACEVVHKEDAFVVLKVDHFDTYLKVTASAFCTNVPKLGFVSTCFDADLLVTMSKSLRGSLHAFQYAAIQTMLKMSHKRTEFPLPITQPQVEMHTSGVLMYEGRPFVRINTPPPLLALSESDLLRLVEELRRDVSSADGDDTGSEGVV